MRAARQGVRLQRGSGFGDEINARQAADSVEDLYSYNLYRACVQIMACQKQCTDGGTLSLIMSASSKESQHRMELIHMYTASALPSALLDEDTDASSNWQTPRHLS